MLKQKKQVPHYKGQQKCRQEMVILKSAGGTAVVEPELGPDMEVGIWEGGGR